MDVTFHKLVTFPNYRGYLVGPTPLMLLGAKTNWLIGSEVEPAQDWIDEQGLGDQRFRSRHDAAVVLLAHMELCPDPRIAALPPVKLTRAADGSWAVPGEPITVHREPRVLGPTLYRVLIHPGRSKPTFFHSRSLSVAARQIALWMRTNAA